MSPTEPTAGPNGTPPGILVDYPAWGSERRVLVTDRTKPVTANIDRGNAGGGEGWEGMVSLCENITLQKESALILFEI